MSKQPPPAPTESTIGPCPTVSQVSRTPWHWKFTQHLRTTRPPPAILVDWNSLHDPDIDIYSDKINNAILSIANEAIPNRSITINHSDQPWINSCIKRHIRKRKRAYRKAKTTGYDSDWIKFRKLRNNVVSLIRNNKRSFYDKIAEKLRSENHSNKSWWSTLKTFYVSKIMHL